MILSAEHNLPYGEFYGMDTEEVKISKRGPEALAALKKRIEWALTLTQPKSREALLREILKAIS
jgi:hypothetical protein